jgi:elongator complex protein 1
VFLLPLSTQAASGLLSDANEAIERLSKYSTRLFEVRQRRTAMAAALAAAEAEAAAAAAAAGGGGGLYDQDDLVSPSIVSGFSMYTDRTSAAATGIGSSSSAASTQAASTLGGRAPMRKKGGKKGGKGAKKIKAGSPEEEAGLEALLVTLGPAQHVLEEAGQLAELLVMLQHVGDAAKLQQRVGQWQAAAADAAALVTQGQQQQQQGVGSAASGQAQAGEGGAVGAAAVGAGGWGGAVAAAAVRWKWDVLRDHK